IARLLRVRRVWRADDGDVRTELRQKLPVVDEEPATEPGRAVRSALGVDVGRADDVDRQPLDRLEVRLGDRRSAADDGVAKIRCRDGFDLGHADARALPVESSWRAGSLAPSQWFQKLTRALEAMAARAST